MHGLSMTSASSFWTVFSSKYRPPASQAAMMFWASWVCGPAAGPIGFAAAEEKIRAGFDCCGCQKCSAGMSKIEPLTLSSATHRRTRSRKGIGRILSLMKGHPTSKTPACPNKTKMSLSTEEHLPTQAPCHCGADLRLIWRKLFRQSLLSSLLHLLEEFQVDDRDDCRDFPASAGDQHRFTAEGRLIDRVR